MKAAGLPRVRRSHFANRATPPDPGGPDAANGIGAIREPCGAAAPPRRGFFASKNGARRKEPSTAQRRRRRRLVRRGGGCGMGRPRLPDRLLGSARVGAAGLIRSSLAGFGLPERRPSDDTIADRGLSTTRGEVGVGVARRFPELYNCGVRQVS